ncbi:MAG: aminotransferase class III-fold pyridoxal phosphate-dependent enzyme, partial [Actinobacteria bacterium]|nr:aminotransferase class III-fold pyridoxal phosphate-dependent enzyme [Actinomycetota bacterium]
APFEPLPEGFVHVPPNDVAALDAAIDPSRTAAVLMEPVLGEGGVVPLDADYLRAARELCTQRGALLMFDEVQTGVGRCGEWFAFQISGVEPDVFTLAKGLGNGLPIGAAIARREYAFGPGEHASTFGGGPVVCTAAVAVLDAIESEGLLENCRARGEQLRDAILGGGRPAVTEVRGAGLLLGVALAEPRGAEVVRALIERGALATEAGASVVRLSPPLVVTAEQVDAFAGLFAQAVGEVFA